MTNLCERQPAASGVFNNGSKNTFVGPQAGFRVTGSNNTVVGGYQHAPSLPALEGAVVLSDGTGRIRAWWAEGRLPSERSWHQISLRKGNHFPRTHHYHPFGRQPGGGRCYDLRDACG